MDKSAVHPEVYELVKQIAADNNVKLEELIGNEKLINTIDHKKYISEKFGEYTVRDVLTELKKPGLDPRSEVQQFEFANIYSIDDVQIGMVVPGIVTNITRFGAFVDIGVKQDGLVHVSEIAHTFIADPNEALKLNQQVEVKVLEVDVARKRIALSIKQTQEAPERKAGGYRPEKLARREKEPVAMENALTVLKNKFKS